MSGNRGRWSDEDLAEMRHAARAHRAVAQHPCPDCKAGQGIGCMTALGSTTTCPQRVALVAEERRNEARR